jgi:hypothetical protein
MERELIGSVPFDSSSSAVASLKLRTLNLEAHSLMSDLTAEERSRIQSAMVATVHAITEGMNAARARRDGGMVG